MNAPVPRRSRGRRKSEPSPPVEFGIKDFFYSAGFILSVVAFLRGLSKDKWSPRREELLRHIGDLEERTATLADEIQRLLQGHKECLTFPDIYRLEKACQLKLNLISRRLNESESGKLFKQYTAWWRIQSEDPLSQTTPKPKLPHNDPGLKARSDGQEALAAALDALRHRVATGNLQPQDL